METKIGHQIQKLRKSKNMSQEKLAEKLGVSRHSIS
ncbi:helix-turn-helix transcriptional regulator, partial [Staphylococcus hominis]